MLKGIDVSKHQGVINWEDVKKEIDFAILRCGFGDDIVSQDDSMFAQYANECTRLGIPFGVYIYSYATNTNHALSEANHVLRTIQGYNLTYPVFYDLEDPNTLGAQSNATILEITETFCNAIQNAGYRVGTYGSKSWYTSKLTDSYYDTMPKWVAQYYSSCTYNGRYDMWQYTSDGAVSGIAGRTDMNYCYNDLTNGTVSTSPSEVQANESGDNHVVYQVYTNKWLSNVVDDSDFAGYQEAPIQALYINLVNGSVAYQVHTTGGKWLSEVTDRNDFAGLIGKNIDAIRARLIDNNEYSIYLRVAPVNGGYYSWVVDNNDFAGIYGKNIGRVQMKLVKKEQPPVEVPVEEPIPVAEPIPVVEPTPIVEPEPVVETPVVEPTPVIETPIETPVVEEKPIETPIETPIEEKPIEETPVETPVEEVPVVEPKNDDPQSVATANLVNIIIGLIGSIIKAIAYLFKKK